MYILLLPQNIVLNSTYLLQIYFTSYNLQPNYFINYLIPYANFLEICQIYNRQIAIGGFLAFFLADFEEISIWY